MSTVGSPRPLHVPRHAGQFKSDRKLACREALHEIYLPCKWLEGEQTSLPADGAYISGMYAEGAPLGPGDNDASRIFAKNELVAFCAALLHERLIRSSQSSQDQVSLASTPCVNCAVLFLS